MAPDPQRALIRGIAVTPTRSFVEGRFGVDAWTHFVDSLPAPEGDVLGAPVLASAWIPFSTAVALIDFTVGLASGNVSILRDLAVHNLDYSTGVVFRAIFKLGTPEFMVARSDQVWRRYYSTGRMTADVRRGKATVVLHDFPEITRTYGLTVLRSIEAVVAKAGGLITSARQARDIARGDDVSEFLLEWK